jgi:hypothetical protein
MDVCDCKYCAWVRSDPDRTNDKLERLCVTRKVLGDRSHMWIARRLRHPAYKFPQIHRIGRFACIYTSDRVRWQQSPHASMVPSDVREAA